MNKKLLLLATGIILLLIVTFLIFSIFLTESKKDETVNNVETTLPTEREFQNDNPEVLESEETTTYSDAKNLISEPIDNSLKRINKKPLGIKVSPNNSPVQPERFYGYHTGTDFEIFTGEENSKIAISAICAGSLIEKRWVSGYGGVAVQQCEINNESVTVVYGHLKLASISKKLNENIDQGEKIGILGEGFSLETDGERKHLHLGIHRGGVVDLKGYAQSQDELGDWIDYESLINN